MPPSTTRLSSLPGKTHRAPPRDDIDHEPYDDRRLVWHADEAQATLLDKAGDQVMALRDEPAAARVEIDAVVGDEGGEPRLMPRHEDQIHRETAFAAAGRTANEDPGLADRHGRRVKGERGRRAHLKLGSQTRKRAPRIFGSQPSGTCAWRFMA